MLPPVPDDATVVAELLEAKMTRQTSQMLEELPEKVALLTDRVGSLELQVSQLREDMVVEFSATRSELRQEMRALNDETRQEMRTLNDKTRQEMLALNQETLTHMRVLHEEVLSRFSLLDEHANGRKRRPRKR